MLTGVRGQDIEADSARIINYTINLDIRDFTNKRISGFTEVKLCPSYEKLANIKLELLKLNISKISIKEEENDFKYDGQTINVSLKEGLKQGDTIVLKIEYEGSPQTDPSSTEWGGFHFNGNYAFNLGIGMESSPHNLGKTWFPCLDNFTSRATYDFYITTLSNHKAACSGSLKSIKTNPDSSLTYHWRLSETIPTYLAAVAVAQYDVVRDTFEGINRKIPIEIYANSSISSKINASFANLKAILSFFELKFGAYKWNKVGYCGVPFNYGAMEHSSMITYPNFMIDGTKSWEHFYTHELSHHWFGNLVTCSTERDMWLNEGWASFAEILYKEGLYGKNSYKSTIRSNHKYVLQYCHVNDKAYLPLYGMHGEDVYSTRVYKKGADAVHALRGYLGDSLFFKTVKSWLVHYAYNNASVSDMEAFFTQQSGINLSSFIKDRIYNPGFTHFSIDSFKVESINSVNYRVEVYVRQKLKGASEFYNKNRIELSFLSKDWSLRTDTINFDGEYGHKSFTLPFAPVSIMLDAEEKLSDATTDNYKTINKKTNYNFTDTYFNIEVSEVTDSAFLRVVHHWVAPDKGITDGNIIKRISEERYWTIEGLIGGAVKGKGKFYFNRTTAADNGYLDNKLLPVAKSSDSLLLIYRPDTKSEWRIVPFIRTGTSDFGYLVTEYIATGEYAFAIGIPGAEIREDNSVRAYLNLRPVQGNTAVEIEYKTKKDAILKITDINSRLIDSIPLKANNKTFLWQNKFHSGSVYFFTLYIKNQPIIIRKIVL
ncbi:MAG: M1 family metallopeptidase [Bacteroidales bacterium]|nr:M1 family metallopeptidase [Bacteroidales bacterium]